MPRLACPEEAHGTLHVVQRGRGRGACFSCAKDRIAYLGALRESSLRHDCAIHAYALMGNHAHLLLSAGHAAGPARLLPQVVAIYARYLADEYGQEEPVWEECYDASPIHARRHLLACMRYVEENPVRAGLVARPADWPWSSYRCNALGERDALVTPHAHYCALGRASRERAAAYAATFADKALSSGRWQPIIRSSATLGSRSPRRSSPSS